MAATMERLDEYRTHNSQLCQRLVDFLPVMITFQSKNILEDKDKGRARDKLVIASHEPLETYLLRYQGLMRYLKEMDEPRYGKLCAVCDCFYRQRNVLALILQNRHISPVQATYTKSRLRPFS